MKGFPKSSITQPVGHLNGEMKREWWNEVGHLKSRVSLNWIIVWLS